MVHNCEKNCIPIVLTIEELTKDIIENNEYQDIMDSFEEDLSFLLGKYHEFLSDVIRKYKILTIKLEKNDK